MPLTHLHVLFELLRAARLFVVSAGQLRGVVTRDRLRTSLEATLKGEESSSGRGGMRESLRRLRTSTAENLRFNLAAMTASVEDSNRTCTAAGAPSAAAAGIDGVAPSAAGGSGSGRRKSSLFSGSSADVPAPKLVRKPSAIRKNADALELPV